MVANINEKEVLEIVKSFNKESNFKINIENDIKSIKLHSQFHRTSKNVWVVEIKIDLMGFEGSNIINLVISDKDENVEYWLDQNGIPQYVE